MAAKTATIVADEARVNMVRVLYSMAWPRPRRSKCSLISEPSIPNVRINVINPERVVRSEMTPYSDRVRNRSRAPLTTR